ncbi:MAG: YbiU family protein [Alphaproteobacteria bacterium]
MRLTIENARQAIPAAKRDLRQSLPNLAEILSAVGEAVDQEMAEIAALQAAGQTVIPEVAFEAIKENEVSAETVALIRRRGAAIVRGVFSVSQAQAWDDELGHYLTSNGYYEAAKDPNLDKYFGTLKAARPQIFGIYWSQPQVAARQSVPLASTRAWLNSLWRWQGPDGPHFDPNQDCVYADRIRRREPGDGSLGLSPHIDGGSVERWIEPNFRRVYAPVFDGNWRDMDPFDGAYRACVEEIPSPAVCQAFRTYQGWTALTEQGPGDGTLQLVPSTLAMSYILLRPLADDVADDDLCGAVPGHSLAISQKWHGRLLEGLVTIPTVYPGDTVWWHPDIVHGVEDAHTGAGYSNVMYIGAAPMCAKNARYLAGQKPAFLEGRSAPDFAAENFEVEYSGRGGPDMLTALGRAQMGFD